MRSASRAVVASAAVLFGGCARGAALDVDVPEGSSLLIASKSAGGETFVVAFERGAPPGGIAAGPTDEIYALTYPWPLARMGLRAGLVRLDEGDPRRPLVPGFVGRVYIAGSADREVAPEAVHNTFPLPLEDVAGGDCEALGGCRRFLLDDVQRDYCELPCDEIAEPVAPTQPSAPAAPMLSPCPASWSEPEGLGARCAPPAELVCPPGSAQWRTSSGCTSIGSPCPSGDWPSPPSSGAVVYVKAGATNGDGSEALPYAALSEVGAVPPGTTILIAPGSYTPTRMREGVTLKGACAERVVLTSTGAGLRVDVNEARLEDLRLELVSPSFTVVEVSPKAPAVSTLLHLHGVEIRTTADHTAIFVDEKASLDASELVIRNPRDGIVIDGSAAAPTFEAAPASADLREVEITGAVGSAIVVRDRQGSLLARDLRIARGATQSDPRPCAIEATRLATIDVARAAFIDVANGALLSYGASGTLEEIYVRGRPEAADNVERPYLAVQAFLGRAHAEVRDLRVARMGIALVSGPDGSLQVEDALFHDVFHGMDAYSSTLTLARVEVYNRYGVGLQTRNTKLVGDDVVIDNSTGARESNFGISATLSNVTLHRARITQSTTFGIEAQDPGAAHRCELSDVDIDGVIHRGEPDDPWQNGDCFKIFGHSRLSRVRCRNSARDGFNLGLAEGVDSDQVIEDVTAEDIGRIGVNLGNAAGSAARIRVDNAGGCGFMSQFSGVPVSDLHVSGTRAADIPVTRELPGVGIWVGAYDLGESVLSELELTRARVEDSEVAGIWVRFGGNITCTDVAVERSPLGLELFGLGVDPTSVGSISYRATPRTWVQTP